MDLSSTHGMMSWHMEIRSQLICEHHLAAHGDSIHSFVVDITQIYALLGGAFTLEGSFLSFLALIDGTLSLGKSSIAHFDGGLHF